MIEMNLKIAIDNLYEVFANYHVEGSLRERSCDCCVSDKDIKQLLSKPLRDLNEDDLRWFMSKAMTTFGDLKDYKHFLPRILELMKYQNSDFIEDFLIYEKLNYAEWKTWESKEIEAIHNYFITLWTDKIENESTSFYEIQGSLDIIEKYVGIENALNMWKKYTSRQSILFIVDFVWNSYHLKNDRKMDVLYDWFSQEAIKDKIQDLYFETKDETLATKTSIVYTILDHHGS